MDSVNSTFVLSVKAASTAAWSVMSTNVVRMPHLVGRKSLRSAWVPPYTALEDTMWSPALHTLRRAPEMAASPELHAYAASVPSSAASWRPRHLTVGLKERPYR